VDLHRSLEVGLVHKNWADIELRIFGWSCHCQEACDVHLLAVESIVVGWTKINLSRGDVYRSQALEPSQIGVDGCNSRSVTLFAKGDNDKDEDYTHDDENSKARAITLCSCFAVDAGLLVSILFLVLRLIVSVCLVPFAVVFSVVITTILITVGLVSSVVVSIVVGAAAIIGV